MSQVRLDPIVEDNLQAVFDLEVHPHQRQFVAPNPWSLAQALAEYQIAWPRAIMADDVVVGLLMLEIDRDEENGRPFWLWRLMIGADHQRCGYGSKALGLGVEEVRRRGGTELFTSWVEGEGSPGPLYLRHGFVPTGEIDEDETVARLPL